MEIRVKVEGHMIEVCVSGSDKKVMDRLEIDLRSVADRFRYAHGYSMVWFVREVSYMLESKLNKAIETLAAEAFVNTARYPLYVGDIDLELLRRTSKEEICMGYVSSIFRFEKSFAVTKFSHAVILPYDASKIDPKGVDVGVYEIVKSARKGGQKLPDDIGGVIDYCLFLYESMR